MKNYIVNWKGYKYINGIAQVVEIGDFGVAIKNGTHPDTVRKKFVDMVKTMSDDSSDYIQIEPYIL
jgi:hypothetical protein